MSGCGAEVLANQLLEDLSDPTIPAIVLPDLTGSLYQVPPITAGPLYDPVTRLTNSHLTEKSLTGNGTFDALMQGFKVHLQAEFDAGRITGQEYTKSYIELTQAAMQNAVQYLIGKENSYWQSLLIQLQARAADAQVVSARIEAESAKARLQSLLYEAQTQKTIYATNKMQLATASVSYCTAKFSLDNLLPKQLDKATKENTLLDAEITNLPIKARLLSEQAESQRAQTLDNRSDNVPVSGVLGKQRQLYDQQITSYKRDAEVKAGKLFTDAWITMKTIDEGVLPPNGFTNANLDQILTTIKLTNNLGT